MAKCRDVKLLKRTDSAVGMYPIKVRVYIDRAEGFGKLEIEHPSGIMFTYNNLPIMTANDHVESLSLRQESILRKMYSMRII